jgi:hypothetical protein
MGYVAYSDDGIIDNTGIMKRHGKPRLRRGDERKKSGESQETGHCGVSND